MLQNALRYSFPWAWKSFYVGMAKFAVGMAKFAVGNYGLSRLSGGLPSGWVVPGPPGTQELEIAEGLVVFSEIARFKNVAEVENKNIFLMFWDPKVGG